MRFIIPGISNSIKLFSFACPLLLLAQASVSNAVELNPNRNSRIGINPQCTINGNNNFSSFFNPDDEYPQLPSNQSVLVNENQGMVGAIFEGMAPGAIAYIASFNYSSNGSPRSVNVLTYKGDTFTGKIIVPCAITFN